MSDEHDKHLISPQRITPESNIKNKRIKKKSQTQEALDHQRNSLSKQHGKCIGRSMENLHTGVKVTRECYPFLTKL